MSLRVGATSHLFPDDSPDEPDHEPRGNTDRGTDAGAASGGTDAEPDDRANGDAKQQRQGGHATSRFTPGIRRTHDTRVTVTIAGRACAEFDQAGLDAASLVFAQGLLLVRAEAATHAETAQPRFTVEALNLREPLTQPSDLFFRIIHADSVAFPMTRPEGADDA